MTTTPDFQELRDRLHKMRDAMNAAQRHFEDGIYALHYIADDVENLNVRMANDIREQIAGINAANDITDLDYFIRQQLGEPESTFEVQVIRNRGTKVNALCLDCRARFDGDVVPDPQSPNSVLRVRGYGAVEVDDTDSIIVRAMKMLLRRQHLCDMDGWIDDQTDSNNPNPHIDRLPDAIGREPWSPETTENDAYVDHLIQEQQDREDAEAQAAVHEDQTLSQAIAELARRLSKPLEANQRAYEACEAEIRQELQNAVTEFGSQYIASDDRAKLIAELKANNPEVWAAFSEKYMVYDPEYAADHPEQTELGKAIDETRLRTRAIWDARIRGRHFASMSEFMAFLKEVNTELESHMPRPSADEIRQEQKIADAGLADHFAALDEMDGGYGPGR